LIKNIDNLIVVFNNTFNGSAFLKIYKGTSQLANIDVSDGDFHKVKHYLSDKESSKKITDWCFKEIKDSEQVTTHIIRKCVNYLEMNPDNIDDVNDIMTQHLLPWNVPLVRVGVKSIYRKRKFTPTREYYD
jgi:hypothetical protein